MKKLISLTLSLLMLLTALPAALASGTTNIPDDAVFYNGHYYYAYRDVMTWTKAKEACEKVGGHLATITTQGEQDMVSSYLRQSFRGSGCWLGATDQAQEGQWQWVTGEAWDYTNWGDAQPDNAYSNGNQAPDGQKDEDYLGIANGDRNWAKHGTWNDFAHNRNGADTSLGYLCEWDYASSWAGEEIQKAEDLGLIPDKLQNADLTKPITRLEFAAVSVKVYEALADTTARPAGENPFVDCADPEMLAAYAVGITNGTSDTTFSPDLLLNREQCATMLTRVFKRVSLPGWTLEQDSSFTLHYTQPALFADDGQISGWARDSVYFMAANNIITGMGNNIFAPKNTTTQQEATHYANATREQALLIAVRMVENL